MNTTLSVERRRTMTPLRVISLGAGVQSTAMLLLVLNGEIEADAAVFADTGWEPAAVYDHLEQITATAAMRGLPVYRVQSGNIRDTERQRAFYDAPYFLLNEDGSRGMARRQCTHQLKLLPIRRKVRELLIERGVKGTPEASVEQLIGISLDEYQRMRTTPSSWRSSTARPASAAGRSCMRPGFR
jgi:3'-phosphoadenosine 5'-phosphosulfate sulfotransferase (PAPS reductase)/FAD synthetase